MRKILIFLLMVNFTLIAYPKGTKCYLYELQGDKLVLKKVSDRPIVAKNKTEAVIILDKDKKPTEEQLSNLKKSILNRLNKTALKEKTLTETEIQKIVDKYLSSDKGKQKIKDIIQETK